MVNEIGTDRSWLGELHLVAVYDRALSAVEVQQNYTAGTYDTCGATANAGADQIVALGDVIQLDGSGSSDPEDDLLTYAWKDKETLDDILAFNKGVVLKTTDYYQKEYKNEI